MRKPAKWGLLLCVSLVCHGLAIAQETAATTPPPKILVILREFLKPGKSGTTHEKSEAAFVQAMRAAKWPTEYLAVDSLSGKPRSLFLTGYASFEAWEKDALAVQKNAVLSAAMDRAGLADGELQSDADAGVFSYREDLSLHPNVELPHMRYFEILLFVVKPGHEREFEELGKMYVNAYQKFSNMRWATYQMMYGQWGSAYAVFTPLKSASDIDKEILTGNEFAQSAGEDALKKMSELSAASIQSLQSNLFIFNPRESYVSDKWASADSFWKVAPAKKAAKPSE